MRQEENLKILPDYYAGTFETLAAPGNPLDVTTSFFSSDFIDLDSNESPDDDFATSIPQHNIGGRQVAEGEEAVWSGYLPAGDYMVIVGDGSGSEGPYDLSLRTLLTP